MEQKNRTGIVIFGSRHKVDHAESTRAFISGLAACADLIVERKFGDFLHKTLGIRLPLAVLEENETIDARYAVSIGGDGTFLSAAHRIGNCDIPIWGINSGRLGFLTDVDCEDAVALIPDFLAGRGRTEYRSLLSIEAGNLYRGFALNELAVMKRETGSIITIDTYLDGHYLAAYEADGLVIATPSGSTAYSMSVNGPIMMPDCQNIILSPIAPHALNMRPLVIPDKTLIRLSVCSRSDSYLIAADGYTFALPCGQDIRVGKAEHGVAMLRLKDVSFAETIRRKLMWGTPVRS